MTSGLARAGGQASGNARSRPNRGERERSWMEWWLAAGHTTSPAGRCGLLLGERVPTSFLPGAYRVHTAIPPSRLVAHEDRWGWGWGWGGGGTSSTRRVHHLPAHPPRQAPTFIHTSSRCRSVISRAWTDVLTPRHPLAETPFEDGTFRLTLSFEETYPNKPPTVKFLSKMFHPNVYANGELCLDILQNRWSPTYDVAAILTSIQSVRPVPASSLPDSAHSCPDY